MADLRNAFRWRPEVILASRKLIHVSYWRPAFPSAVILSRPQFQERGSMPWLKVPVGLGNIVFAFLRHRRAIRHERRRGWLEFIPKTTRPCFLLRTHSAPTSWPAQTKSKPTVGCPCHSWTR